MKIPTLNQGFVDNDGTGFFVGLEMEDGLALLFKVNKPVQPFLPFKELDVLRFRKYDFLAFTVLTLLSVLSGQTTVFYIIYFFWWNELIRVVVDRIFSRKNENAIRSESLSGKAVEWLAGLFLMGIYWVFIVVFFGFIASSGHTEMRITNLKILVFQNWFFLGNLILVALERWYLHKKQKPVRVYSGIFNPNILVMHVSIILGGVMMFMVVKPFPEVFTPENQWGSLMVVLPFLLLRYAADYFTSSGSKSGNV